MRDYLRLVLLDTEDTADIAEDLTDDGGTDYDLLAFFQQGPEIGRQIRLTLASVDN